MFLIDHETPVDLLYYDAIAETIVGRVLESKAKPITVGVHGDWGAGKSSVLAMAEKRFGSTQRHCVSSSTAGKSKALKTRRRL
jgi:putative protein kinase ArgK-like GTPase of G3E family